MGKVYQKVFVFVFYCYITNYNKLNGLKQHTFIISWFHRSEVQVQLNWISCFGSHMAAIKASSGLGSHVENELEKEFTSKLTEIAGRTITLMLHNSEPQFLLAVGWSLIKTAYSSLPRGLFQYGCLLHISKKEQVQVRYQSTSKTKSYITMQTTSHHPKLCPPFYSSKAMNSQVLWKIIHSVKIFIQPITTQSLFAKYSIKFYKVGQVNIYATQ